MIKIETKHEKDKFGFLLLAIYAFGGLGLELLRRLDSRFDNSFFSERLIVTNDALNILYIQTFVMLFVFLLARNLFLFPIIAKSRSMVSLSPYIIYFGVLCLLLLFSIYHLEYIWLQMPDRFEGAFYVNALITIGSSALILAYNVEKFRPLSVISVLLFFFALTYAAATGSRAAALPFLAFAACAFVNRNKIAALALALLSLKALLTALAIRAEPSFANFAANFFTFDASELFNNFTSIVALSFPAGYTVQVALDAHSSPDSLWENILYLSPIPSGWLPEALFVKSTLSDALGFDSNVLGINTDIYSDPIYRGGIVGAFTYPVFLFGLYFLSMFFAFRMPQRWQYSAAMMSKTLAAYGLIGGMVFSYRSATRWQLVFILILAIYIRLIKGRNSNI